MSNPLKPCPLCQYKQIKDLLLKEAQMYIDMANCSEQYEIKPPPDVVEKTKQLMRDNPSLMDAPINKGLSIIQFLVNKELIDSKQFNKLLNALTKSKREGLK